MVVVVAAQESHCPGAIGQFKSECSFEEAPGRCDVSAVQVDVREAKRKVLSGSAYGMDGVTVQEAQNVAFGCLDRHRRPPARFVDRCSGANYRTSCRPDGCGEPCQ